MGDIYILRWAAMAFCFRYRANGWMRLSRLRFWKEREEIVYIKYVVFVGQEQMSTYGVPFWKHMVVTGLYLGKK